MPKQASRPLGGRGCLDGGDCQVVRRKHQYNFQKPVEISEANGRVVETWLNLLGGDNEFFGLHGTSLSVYRNSVISLSYLLIFLYVREFSATITHQE